MREYLQLLFLSFFLTHLLIFVFRFISLKYQSLSRKQKVPLVGGVSFALAFFASYFWLSKVTNIIIPPGFMFVLTFAFAMMVIGVVDDIVDFSLWTKIIIQVAVIMLYLRVGKITQIYFLPGWLNYLISFLWIMGITNAFNHLDIYDGLCGGISLVISLGFLAVAFFQGNWLFFGLFLVLFGVLAAFLFWNFPPARVYMGNSGSHFLGFLFATMSMYIDYATRMNPSSVLVPVVIMAFPVIDTSFLILARLRKGVTPFKKSDDHIFLKLITEGYNPIYTLGAMICLSIMWGITGVSLNFGASPLFFSVFVLSLIFTARVILPVLSSRK